LHSARFIRVLDAHGAQLSPNEYRIKSKPSPDDDMFINQTFAYPDHQLLSAHHHSGRKDNHMFINY
jgi:hypothetical protein